MDTGSEALAHAVVQSTTATVDMLQAALVQQARVVQALEATVVKQGEQLQQLLSRPVEVKAGNVEVNGPARASGFEIEYGTDGRPARLVPHYGTSH